MRASLASPRLRRRLARLGLAAVVVAAAVAAGIVFDGGKTVEPTIRESGPAIVPEQPEEVEVTAADRKLALATAAEFVRTAVRRERLADSYDLVSPALRAGFTRREWATGAIPVQPYPVDGARWRFDYGYRDEIGLQVLVAPGAGSKLRPTVFLMALKATGAGAQRRWLVDSWVPNAASAEAAAAGEPLVGPAARARQTETLGAVWLLVPVAVLALGAAVPLALALRERRRVRRAYRSSSSSPS
jgi:hypothetical protein